MLSVGYSFLLLTTSPAPAQSDPSGWLVNNEPVPEVDFANLPSFPAPAPTPTVITNTPPGGIMPMFAPPPGQTPPATFGLGLQETIAPSGFDRIKELARGLDYDWEKCYRFVHDNIAYAPYHGIMRGPERTLLDREGNDADQAFLLLALLRASGYDATIYHTTAAASTSDFYIPLYNFDGNTPYNAADWLGVSTDGTESDIDYRVRLQLVRGGYKATPAYIGGVPSILTDHFWAALTLGNQTRHLDPSFKPSQRTPCRDIPTSMAYNRAGLITAAPAGLVTANGVRTIPTSKLEAHLNTLAANLRASWTDTHANAATFIGETRIIPQAPGDITYFHAALPNARQDFLAKTDPAKNAFRAPMTITHGPIQKTFCLDEVGARGLWLSYTATTDDYPKATLWLDDTVLAPEASGSSAESVAMTIAVTKTLAATKTLDSGAIVNLNANTDQPYSLKRNTAYVYAIPVGFGGDAPGGMRSWATEELAKLNAAGLANTNPRVTARAMQVAGHQWLAQCVMTETTYNRITGTNKCCFYNIGVAAQERAPYVDMKNAYSYSTGSITNFDGRMLFSSALEHAVLDQLNGAGNPAVSTVKAIELMNAVAISGYIYFVTAANYSAVTNQLSGYKPSQLDGFDTATKAGRVILLPAKGDLTLNQWNGHGYIEFGPQEPGSSVYATSMGIAVGLNGGSTTKELYADANVYQNKVDTASSAYYDANIPQTFSGDPVAMPSGAFTDSATDLTSHGIRPLAFTRHYDSRARYTTGGLGKGWSHNYEASVRTIADPDAVMAGRGSVDAVIPTAVAVAVVEDMLAEQHPALTAGETARRWVIAALTVQWWLKQLVDASVAVTTGTQSLTFNKRPDGTYAPYPGVTSAFTKESKTFTLAERLGNTYTFNADGKLTTITAPDGNKVTLSYPSGRLSTIAASGFANSLTVAWITTGGRTNIASVKNNAGHTVNYTYNTGANTAKGTLSKVNDPESKNTTYTYDTSTFALLTHTGHDGRPLIRNTYNALGQVTNQISAVGAPWAFGYAANTGAWDEDPDGNRQTLLFSPEGRLLQRTAYDGLTTAYDYDAHGHTTATYRTDPGDPTLLLPHAASTYDPHGNLLSTTRIPDTSSLLPATYSFAYDASHRLTAATDPLGRTTAHAYDAQHRPVRTLYPDGSSVTNAFDTNGRIATVKNLAPDGTLLRQTAYAYPSSLTTTRGQPTTKTVTGPGLPPAGLTETYAYNSTSYLLATRKDPLGNTTAYTYNKRGQPLTLKDPRGNTTTYTYGDDTRLATAKDPLDHTTTHRWTPSGQPAATLYPDGSSTTNAYDALDRLLWSRDPRGTVTSNAYDAAGRVLSTFVIAKSGAMKQPSAFTYDAVGNLLTSTSPLGHTTSYTYDALDRPVTVTDPLGNATATAYDLLSRPVAVTDPLGKTRTTAYDALGRTTSQTSPLGHTHAFAYDPLGNQTAHTNAEGHVYSMAYDAMGRMTASTNALGIQTSRISYDDNGNPTTRLDANGMYTLVTYDALNRPTVRLSISIFRIPLPTVPPTPTQVPIPSLDMCSQFFYDAAGNLTDAFNSEALEITAPKPFQIYTFCQSYATSTFAYDSTDRLISSTVKLYPPSTFVSSSVLLPLPPPSSPLPAVISTICWQRDPGGLVTNLTYATGKAVAYTHDAEGRIATVKDWLGNEWTFTRDLEGRVTQISPVIASGAKQPSSVFSYDPAGRLSSWNIGTIAGRTISYDEANRRICDEITHGAMPKPTLQRTALNTFDAADRLTSASVRYGQGADSTPHITETFVYDGNGALTNWVSANPALGTPNLELSYNALGQISTLTTNHYPLATAFSYDALGNRIKTADGHYWLPDHADPLKRPLMECDDTGAIIRYYIWGDNRLLGFIDANGVLTVAHCDDFGSVTALTDSSGNVIFTASYGPHGEDWGSTGVNPTPFTWLGGYGVMSLDDGTPLKLYLTRHRLYSATLNRFLSADPLGIAGGLNLYAYGEGNPMAYIDPLGLCAEQSRGYEMNLTPFGPSTSVMPDVSKYGIFSVLAPATFTGSTAYQDHYNSYTLPMLQTIAGSYALMTAVADIQQGFMVEALFASAARNTVASAATTTLWPGPENGRQVINGIEYTTHALERMMPKGLAFEGNNLASRGIPPSVVENAIRYGTVSSGKEVGTVVRTYENVRVITNTSGTRVITVMENSK